MPVKSTGSISEAEFEWMVQLLAAGASPASNSTSSRRRSAECTLLKDPLSVIGFVSNLPAIIGHDTDNAHWKKLIKGCTAWQKCQTLLEDAVRPYEDERNEI